MADIQRETNRVRKSDIQDIDMDPYFVGGVVMVRKGLGKRAGIYYHQSISFFSAKSQVKFIINIISL